MITFINQYQTEVVPCRVLLVDLTKCRSQVEPAEEKSDRNGFACATGLDIIELKVLSDRSLPRDGEPSIIYIWSETR